MRHLVLICMCLAMRPALAKAPTWAQDCQRAGQQSTQACTHASNQAKAMDNAQGSANQARYAGSDQIRNPAGALQQQAQAQAARLTAAKNTCELERQKCERACTQEERDRASRAGGPLTDPIAQAARAQSGQVDRQKQSSCLEPINALMSQLDQGAKDASKAGQESNDTKEASNGSPPPLSPPQNSGESQAPNTPRAMNCDLPSNATDSTCNDHFVSKCSSDMGSTVCSDFINRYCGEGDDGGGSTFCAQANAYRHCGSAWPVGTTEHAQCSNTAAFADPTKAGEMPATSLDNSVASESFSPERVATGAGTVAGSGGFKAQSGGAGGAGSSPSDSSVSAASVSLPRLGNLDTGGGGGGGRVSAHSNGAMTESEDSSRRVASPRAPSSAVVDSPRPVVGQQYGPSIFSIQTTAYQDLCARGRLHCRR